MKLKASLFSFRKKKQEPKNELLSDKEISELWTQCPSCKSMIYSSELKNTMSVCAKCNYHFRVPAYERIEYLVDPNSWEELFNSVSTLDPLKFTDLKAYTNRIEEAKKSCGASESVITGIAKINNLNIALSVMEFSFMGGSMGSVMGERFCRICEHAIENKLPVISICSSGGARMQEGLFSLMQMSKTSAILKKLKDNKLLFISVLTDPTYGGVSASFAMLGDIIIAEPKAKIGFAGPRVIEETIRQKLPKDFQTSEYLLEHGQIDLVIPRQELKNKIYTLVKMHSKNAIIS